MVKNYIAFWRYSTSVCLLLLTTISWVSGYTANAYKHWQYIRTEHYDIYFLSNMVYEAQRMARTMEHLYVPINKTLGSVPKRTTVFLQSQLAVANGSTAPTNLVKLYTFPTQSYNFLYNNDWLNFVALHELRHVGQFSLMFQNYSLVKPIWLALSLFTPVWLMEGDAVGIETGLSTGGRGRVPAFLLHYKINILEERGLSYYQYIYGSSKYFVPDQYRLGYVLTTYLRRHYGAGIIKEMLERKSYYDALNPCFVEQKIRQLTGKPMVEIFNDANKELKTLWTNQLKGMPITTFKTLNHRNSEDHVNYNNPHPTAEGVVVLQKGIALAPYFIHIDSQGNEEKLLGLREEVHFSMAKNILYWIENSPSPRWSHSSSTTLKVYDFENKIYKSLATGTRYVVVVASPDGTRLAVVESNETYQHRIVILDAQTGKKLHVLPNPNNYYYFTPSWSKDSKKILAIKLFDNKSALVLIDLQTYQEEELIPLTQELIGAPVAHYPYVYYSSAYSGIDNIYVIDLKTKKRFQVTSSKYGAYNPIVSADGQWLFYNDCGRNGMDVVKIALHPASWLPLEKVQDRSINYYAPLVIQEDNPPMLDAVPQTTYPVQNYNFWKKFGIGFDNLSLVAEDFFETIYWEIVSLRHTSFYTALLKPYIHIEPVLSTKITYKGFYPVISFQAGFSKLLQKDTPIENVNELAFHVPFEWGWRQYSYKLDMSTSTFGIVRLQRNARLITNQQYCIDFYRLSARSPRDLESPWGQSLRIVHAYTIAGELPKTFFSVSGFLFFPGLFTNHSLQFSHSFNYRTDECIQDIPYEASRLPRTPIKGYQIIKRLATGQSANVYYVFPLFYPDLSWSKFFYLREIVFGVRYKINYTFDAILKHTLTGDIGVRLMGLKLKLIIGYASRGGSIFDIETKFSIQ